MTALWQIGIVNVYVDEDKPFREIKRAEIIPLDALGSSTYHHFGTGGKHYGIHGLVVGQTNYEQLETYASNNTTVAFVTPWETVASAKIHGKIEAETIKYSGAVIDGTAYSPGVTPLYLVSLEIIDVT